MSSRLASGGYLAGMMIPAMLVMVLALVGLAATTRLLVRDAVRAQIDGEIDSDIAGLLGSVARYRIVGVIDAVDRRVSGSTSRHDPAVYAVRLGGQVVAGNVRAWPMLAPARPGETAFFAWQDDRDGREPGTLVAAKVVHVPAGFDLLVGRKMQAYHSFERRLVPLLLAAVAIVALLCMLLLLRQTARIVRRVEGVNEVLGAAARGDYSRRLAPERRGDELTLLERGVDEMLKRSEALVDDLRRLSERLAHEMKRPIATMLRLARDTDGDPAGRLAELVERLTDQLTLFDALLELSEVRTGSGLPHAALDLAEVAGEAYGLYQAVDPDRNIRLLFDPGGPAPIYGERWLLLRAMCNLIDNALRHSPADGTVTVRVVRSPGEVRVEVRDEGPGLGGRSLDEVLRSGRQDARRDPGSHGLGLPVTEAIVLRHGGAITAREGSGPQKEGLTVSISFPSA
jgi:signal transduction histidine kinase